MSKKKFKLLIRILVVLICVGIIVGIFVRRVKKDKGLDGNEWLSRQYEYMNQFTGFCLNMDEVYALYISEDMNEANFLIEYGILLNQWDVLEATYKRFLKENPVKPNGHSYLSRRGEGAINDLRNTVANILEKTKNNNSVIGRPEMLYMYLSYKQNIQMALAEYTVAIQWINDSKLTDEEFENLIYEYKDQLNSSMKEVSEKETEKETKPSLEVNDN